MLLFEIFVLAIKSDNILKSVDLYLVNLSPVKWLQLYIILLCCYNLKSNQSS